MLLLLLLLLLLLFLLLPGRCQLGCLAISHHMLPYVHYTAIHVIVTGRSEHVTEPVDDVEEDE